jgi:hypothetical protein
MSPEQPRTDANSRERSSDHQYSLSIEQAADLYAKAGYPRTPRAIQKYCAVSKLDCRKVETDTGEKYLVAPYSVERHIVYINEVANGREQSRPFATRRDHSRTDANVRALENKGEQADAGGTNSGEQRRTDATVRSPESRYIERLEGEVDFLRGQLSTKDGQIKELTERSRETNVLIAGLQKMLGPLLSQPKPENRKQAGENGGYQEPLSTTQPS